MKRKTAVKRAFQGLAGSSFARVSEPTITILGPSVESQEELTASIIKKAGRPRKHTDAAARQRACRASKALKAEAKRRENEWRRVICENYDSKGRLSGEFSGDNGAEKMALIADAARRSDEGHGRRVAPQGWSSEKNEDTDRKKRKIETDKTFVNKQNFPLDWKLDDADKREIVRELTQQIFTPENRGESTIFDPNVEDVDIQTIYTCQICGVSVNILLQAIEHIGTYHGCICRDEFKRRTPKSSGECTEEYHDYLKSSHSHFCGRCHTDFKDLYGNIVTNAVEV